MIKLPMIIVLIYVPKFMYLIRCQTKNFVQMKNCVKKIYHWNPVFVADGIPMTITIFRDLKMKRQDMDKPANICPFPNDA